MSTWIASLVLLLVLSASGAARALVFSVTQTGDAGAGSLRQALLDANANAGADVIQFAIPGAGPHVIQPAGLLPQITDPVTIDGATQPGASANTQDVGWDGVIQVGLDMSGAGPGGSGLIFQAGSAGSAVRGLAVFGGPFGTSGIILRDDVAVEGCFLGLDPSGAAAGGGATGIDARGPAQIGGPAPAQRNVISGGGGNGASVGSFVGETVGPTVRNNYVGTDPSGTQALGNGLVGVSVTGAAQIGGPDVEDGNVISANAVSEMEVLGQADGGPAPFPSGAVVQNNQIGGDATGSAVLNVASPAVIVVLADGVQFGGSGVGGAAPAAAAGGGGGSVDPEDFAPDGPPGNVFKLAGIAIEIIGAFNWLVERCRFDTSSVNVVDSEDGLLKNNTFVDGDPSTPAVTVTGTSRAVISQSNAILGYGSPFFDLGGDGDTPDDVDDPDTGPNDLVNHGQITSFAVDAATQAATFGFSYDGIRVAQAYTLQFYAALSCAVSAPSVLVGVGTIISSDKGLFTFSAVLGHAIWQIFRAGRVQVTDQSGNSSEYSDCAESEGQTGFVEAIKTVDKERVGFDELITYQIVVRAGDTGADNVSILDFLPERDASWVGITHAGWACSLHDELLPGEPIPNTEDEHLECDLQTPLGPNETSPPIVVQVRSLQTETTLTNTVEASATGIDGGEASVDTEVTGEAELGVTKTPDDDTATAEDTVRFTIVVSHTADSLNDAQNVRVIDTLPRGWTLVGVEGSPLWTCGPQVGRQVTCTFGTLAEGQSAPPLVLVAEAPSDTQFPSENFVNNVQVVSDNADPATGAAPPVTVLAVADIAFIGKSVQPAKVAVDAPPPGNHVVYTLRVLNQGPSTAFGVVISDPIPGGLAFVSAPANCTHTAGVVTCNLGDIPKNDIVEVQIVAEAEIEGLVLCNTAGATTQSLDRNPSDNTSPEACVQAVGLIDLSVTKERITNATQVGVPIFYTVTVKNESDRPASNVVVTDLLPQKPLADVQATPEKGTCDVQLANDRIVCDIGTLDAGEEVDIVIQFTPLMPGEHCDVASAVADQIDPDQDVPRVCDEVVNGPDVAPGKRYTPDLPTPDVQQALVFEIELSVTNGGDAAAENVMLSDTLPQGMVFIGFTLNSAGCAFQNNTVTCDVGTLGAGATFAMRFAARFSGRGELCNEARVTTTTTQPTANDTTEACVDVTPTTDLHVEKTAPPFAGVGQEVTHTIEVTLVAPGDAEGVSVQDELISNLQYVDATFRKNNGPEQQCAEQGGDAVCSVGPMAVGDTVVMTVKALTTGTGMACDRADAVATTVERNTEDNNPPQVCTEVIEGLADVEVRKRGPYRFVPTGQSFEYTVEVENGGPDTASDVMMTDLLPEEVTYEEATFEKALEPGVVRDCQHDGLGEVTCAIGALAPGEIATITIRVTPNTQDVLFCNRAEAVNDREFDPTEPNVSQPDWCLTAIPANRDTDGDGVNDVDDNSPTTPNPDQTDSDGDGHGNASDGDFNQDGFVGGPDFDIFLQCFNKAVGPGQGPPEDPECRECDMNGDGFVGGPDFNLFLMTFNTAQQPPPLPGSTPGPCGLGMELALLLPLIRGLHRRRGRA